MKLRKGISATVAGLMMASTLAACSGGGDGETTTLSVYMPNYVLTDYLQTRLPEFTEATGIEVDLTTAGDDQLDDQHIVAFNARSSDVDVLNFRPMQNIPLFGSNQWLEDLTPYLENAPAEYDAEDFDEGTMQAVQRDGAVLAIPSTTERQILYYRTDLLEAAGLEVPQTMDELLAAVDAVHDPDNGVYGFVARGNVNAAVTQLSSFLYSFGGDWTDGDQGAVASPEAIEAYEYYGGLLRDYGPPGTQDMSWQQALPIFAQGRAAFYPEGDSFFTNFLDDSQSSVVDTVGYAQIPAGPAGSRPYSVPNTAFGISAFSENKEASWEFIQWATSPEMTLALQAEGIPQARDSAWADEEANQSFPEELREVLIGTIADGVAHDRPQVTQVNRSRDIVGRPIVVAIEGGDVAAAAQTAQDELTALIAEDS